MVRALARTSLANLTGSDAAGNAWGKLRDDRNHFVVDAARGPRAHCLGQRCNAPIGIARGAPSNPGARLCSDGRTRTSLYAIGFTFPLANRNSGAHPAAGHRVLHLGAAAASARHRIRALCRGVRLGCSPNPVHRHCAHGATTRARQRGHQCRATKIRRRFSQNASRCPAVGLGAFPRHGQHKQRGRGSGQYPQPRLAPEGCGDDARSWRLSAEVYRPNGPHSDANYLRQGTRAAAPARSKAGSADTQF